MKLSMAFIAVLAPLLQQVHADHWGCNDAGLEYPNGIADDRCGAPGKTAKFCVQISNAGTEHRPKCDSPFNVRRFWLGHWLYTRDGSYDYCRDNPAGAWACMGGVDDATGNA
ncbi:unnamed protein product [Zymoseptoria tritici ST99CH_1A5]|uniref:Secreted protein n=2 Tax=Zymoseptoria tritici TaxID=1047171 RepID=A0A2H1G6M3_ZYMTR|nr:unnamed protein product [Zymoseptoria tritici ST99CH_1E4]SMR50392.1 unnamed protein product [Zymoseptoria tritici ST99CH_3D1]SMY23082.1 unnamed protein product [Zymoseptoria tritici ST99CH_1A5]